MANRLTQGVDAEISCCEFNETMVGPSPGSALSAVE